MSGLVHVLWRRLLLEWLLLNVLSNGWIFGRTSFAKDRRKDLSDLGYITHLKEGR